MDDQGITIDPKRLTDVNLLKRHVLKRCIYGVDINPMAVELAKVSLWLDCFTLGAPLSFLDHHLRCGNSLIGATVEEVDKIRAAKGQLLLSASSDWQGLLQAIQGMIEVGGLPDVTSAQVARSRTAYKSALSNLESFKKILNIHTARWFVKHPNGKAKAKKAKPKEDPFDYILKSGDLFEWSHGKKAPLLDIEPYQSLLSKSALAGKKKRFFHWELEFPEVFYGPRPGTTQKIERLEGAGFDAVIGNPPYDVLASEELGYDVSDDLAFFEDAPIYQPAIRGKKNLYKLFICRAVAETGTSGACSFIVPMPLLGDDQAAGVRRLLLDETELAAVEAFPQKDNPHNRVFLEAKLATTIFTTRKESSQRPFTLRTHPGRLMEADSQVLRLTSGDIMAFDPENGAIPSCTQDDWDLAVRILNQQGICRLGSLAESFQGEINETNERAKGNLTEARSSPLVLRGSNVCMYAVREASQGEHIRLNVKKFLAGKDRSSKAFAFERERVGFQRSAPQNNFRRIIACRIPKGSFCFDTVSFVTDESSKIELDLLVAFLNSKIMDWYFRLGSTNSKVNEYQYNTLPIPILSDSALGLDWHSMFENGEWKRLGNLLCKACDQPGSMPKSVAHALAEISRCIQEIEAKRVLKNRSERSRLAPESQPIQDAIDAVLFRCYGLSEDEAEYVQVRLEEML